VVRNIAVDQICNGRRRPPRALITGGIKSLIDLLA
jgi:hypothetical protein